MKSKKLLKMTVMSALVLVGGMSASFVYGLECDSIEQNLGRAEAAEMLKSRQVRDMMNYHLDYGWVRLKYYDTLGKFRKALWLSGESSSAMIVVKRAYQNALICTANELEAYLFSIFDRRFVGDPRFIEYHSSLIVVKEYLKRWLPRLPRNIIKQQDKLKDLRGKILILLEDAGSDKIGVGELSRPKGR